jgi:putative hydrolase
MKDIKIIADYHTHTIYSHGKGTVLENALVARQKGIKVIAITDHGFNHFAFNLKRRKLPNLRKDIEFAKKQTGVNILLGVEANILSTRGDIDVSPEDYEKLDIVVCGFHKGVWGKLKIFDTLFFMLRNILANKFKIYSKRLIESNTNAYINAVEKNNIDIISHINHVAKVDCKRVAEACARTNTYIEINAKRIHLTQKDVDDMLSTSVKFVIDSDAHTSDRVGETSIATKMVEMFNIPLDRIVNINNVIELKKQKYLESLKK